jgi:hypothetical protein
MGNTQCWMLNLPLRMAHRARVFAWAGVGAVISVVTE